MANPEIDILLDGYISYTLTPRLAEEYLKRFMRCLENERDGTLVACDAGWVVVRSTMMARRQQQWQPSGYQHEHGLGALPAARTLRLSLEDAHRELFDCKVDLGPGTIVPQPTWIGVTDHTGMFCPIFFVQRCGVLGVSYKNREAERGALHNATMHAPGVLKRTKQNVRVRIQVSRLSPICSAAGPAAFAVVVNVLAGVFFLALVARV
ncbi:hypothetical protein BC827DRAFT_354037 [Russula dissimulans]|nr:hypothetical protein BC827DRAFT_354037 [Russula dissimulans]